MLLELELFWSFPGTESFLELDSASNSGKKKKDKKVRACKEPEYPLDYSIWFRYYN